MKISVAYGASDRQVYRTFQMPDGATIRLAIKYSGILQQFPDIDLEHQKVGLFGKIKSLDTLLHEGDRVEIYRPITVDPDTVPRRLPETADTEEVEG